ncbi:Conserved protein of unknown function [Mycobacterium canettii CIPT 140070017]|nr:Conserved protein of unknown function [Mycobacterium canettii CIPT 140070017]
MIPDAVSEAIGIPADDIPMAARWIGSRPCSLTGQPNAMGDEMGDLEPGLAGQRCVDRLVTGRQSIHLLAIAGHRVRRRTAVGAQTSSAAPAFNLVQP